MGAAALQGSASRTVTCGFLWRGRNKPRSCGILVKILPPYTTYRTVALTGAASHKSLGTTVLGHSSTFKGALWDVPHGPLLPCTVPLSTTVLDLVRSKMVGPG